MPETRAIPPHVLHVYLEELFRGASRWANNSQIKLRGSRELVDFRISIWRIDFRCSAFDFRLLASTWSLQLRFPIFESHHRNSMFDGRRSVFEVRLPASEPIEIHRGVHGGGAPSWNPRRNSTGMYRESTENISSLCPKSFEHISNLRPTKIYLSNLRNRSKIYRRSIEDLSSIDPSGENLQKISRK